jgi:2-keto-4-pentenoate hydratase
MAVVSPRLAAAMREQLTARQRLLQNGATHIGWKLGMGDREGIDGHIVVGHLTSATLLESGATHRAELAEDLHVDVEAYVELDGDGPEAIGGYGVALEIVDLTPLQREPDSIVATNIFHRAVSFGPLSPDEPSNAEVGLRVNGELRRTNPWPADISTRLTAAAEVLEADGANLRAGDRIITGSIVQVGVSAGDSIVAVIGGDASVTLRLVA